MPALAWAGEVKFSAQPLETGEDGKLTAEGRKAAVTDLPSLPGEEVWELHLWAELDKGAPGPLYVEFFGKHDGKTYLAHRHEVGDYEGDKYVSLTIELDGNAGFNKGKTYQVKLTQAAAKGGKDILLAEGKLTLAYTEGAPEGEDEDGAGEDGEEQTDPQDELDSFGGEQQQEAPPPIEPTSKKGCAVDPHGGPGAGLLVLVLAAIVPRGRHAPRR